MKRTVKAIIILIGLVLHSAAYSQSQTGIINGIVKEEGTGITLPGVNVLVEGTLKGSSTDHLGAFTITGLQPGKCNLIMTFISYKTIRIEGVEVKAGEVTEVSAEMKDASIELGDVVVVATKRHDSEVSIMNNIKQSPVVVTGISAQLISRTHDKDASEVVRRLPGVSVVDDRFIIVRGLSSRYNNVWLNNASAPSLEADVRSFSFDLIPSSMIENIMIYKSPLAELPADYSGGFIKLMTTGIPSKNSVSVSYGTAFRQYSTFNDFYKEEGSSSDWLTTGKGYRDLPEEMPSHLDLYESATNQEIKNRVTLLGKSLHNNWEALPTTAIPDQKFSLGISRRFEKGSLIAGNVTSLTYSYSNSFGRFENNNYSIYNFRYDTPGIIDEFEDRQYKTNAKIGLLHNWTLYPVDGLKLEIKNFLTNSSQSRVTLRKGREWYNNGRYIISGENKFSNRMIYSGQLGAEKQFFEGNTIIDITAGYSLSAKDEPDIKRYRYIGSDDDSTSFYMLFGNNPDLSSVSRMWLELDETNTSYTINFTQKIKSEGINAEFKAGAFSESKNRSFRARNFGYTLAGSESSLSYTNLPVNEIFAPENINTDEGLKLKEITALSDSYDASSFILAGYLSLKLRIKKSDISLGLRVEKSSQELSSYRQGTTIAVKVQRDTINFFPSASYAFNLTSKSIIRATWGISVNRPEFREMAPFYYVDFDQNAGIYGNEGIKEAYIQNFDLRYEFYPGNNETFNVGIFYKNFSNPIEVTIMGNNPAQFSFDNITSAYSYGFEAEARKSLEFINASLKDFTTVLNLALIKSSVAFDRPLQGQSPYIVNIGLYYHKPENGIMASIFYNRIGKRIIAVGRPSPNAWESIPDIYEMPRNEVDLTFSKKIGEKIEIKAGIKDLFGERVVYSQNVKSVVDMTFYGSDGYKTFDRTQITKSYYPGRQYSLGLSFKF